MKVLDVESLRSGIDFTVSDIEGVYSKISAIQRSVRAFYNLEDDLKGQSGKAIRNFYQDTHEPFLIFLYQSLVDYKNVLTDLKDIVQEFESNDNGFVSQAYLENDVIDGFDQVEKTAIELASDANGVIDQVNDLVSVKKIDESEIVNNVRKGKENADNIVEDLNLLDNHGTSQLEKAKEDLQKMRTFLSEIESKFQSGDLSIRDYDPNVIKDLAVYKEITDSIYNKGNSILSSLDDYNIDEMSIDEIKKLKEEISARLDRNSRDILDQVYIDLENGVIDRRIFQMIIEELNGTELSEMDNDSRAYLEAVYNDFKENKVDTDTFTSVFSGIVSSGAIFIKDILQGQASEMVVDFTVESVERWIKNTTELFLNPSLVASTASTGTNVTLTLTSTFKDQLRNVVNFGAKHGPTFIGAAIDGGMQVYQGEDVEHATVKAVGHIGTAVVGRMAGVAIAAKAGALLGLTIGTGGTALIAIAAGVVVGYAFDWVYDKWGRDLVDNVVDVGKNVVSNIGNAVKGFFGGLKSAFSS